MSQLKKPIYNDVCQSLSSESWGRSKVERARISRNGEGWLVYSRSTQSTSVEKPPQSQFDQQILAEYPYEQGWEHSLSPGNNQAGS